MKSLLVKILGIILVAGAVVYGVVVLYNDEMNSKEFEAIQSEVLNEVTIENVKYIDEKEFQQIIHEMSHQKVHADTKWGHLEITPERIDYLIAVLSIYGEEYENKELYQGILLDWKKGDFSNAVEAHNSIWRLQNGNIGKATRLLTPEEEQEYIEKHFR